MCYLVRQQQADGVPGGASQSPGSQGFHGVRPRWAGAAALAVMGGIALAASLLTTPPAAQQADSAVERGAPAPVATRSETLPGGAVEQTAVQMDDGVPASPQEVVKAKAGNCHHGL